MTRWHGGALVVAAIVASLAPTAACSSDSAPPPEPFLGDSPALPVVADEDGVRATVDVVRRDHFSELAGVTVLVCGFDSDKDFFTADVALETLSRPGRERTYRIDANRSLYGQGLGNRAICAIVTHELKHVRDYVGMDEKALVAFAVDYAVAPQAAYEQSTNLFALERGVGVGLRDFRRWLCTRVDDETREAKRRDYYTPEKIETWLRDHPGKDRPSLSARYDRGPLRQPPSRRPRALGACSA